MGLKVLKDDKPSIPAVKRLSTFLQWIRPGSSIKVESTKKVPGIKRSEQTAKKTSSRDERRSATNYVTVILKPSKKAPVPKQRTQDRKPDNNIVPVIEPLKKRVSIVRHNDDPSPPWKLKRAVALESVADDGIPIIEPAKDAKPISFQDNCSPADWKLKRAQPLEDPQDGAVLKVSKTRKRHRSRSSTRKTETATLSPFPPRKSSRSHSRRRTADNGTAKSSHSNTHGHKHNEEEKSNISKNVSKGDGQVRGRSTIGELTVETRTPRNRQRTPSPLPELDGKSVDSPDSPQCHELETPVAANDTRSKRLQDGMFASVMKDVYADPIIFDESQHDPEDFYNPNFSPASSSPLKPYLSKSIEHGKLQPTIHLAPPAFELHSDDRPRPSPTRTKSVYIIEPHKRSPNSSSPTPANGNAATRQRNSVHELPAKISITLTSSPKTNHHSDGNPLLTSIAEKPSSARPCTSYERLRPVAPHRRVHSENSTPVQDRKASPSSPATRHTRSPSTYSYTPTRDTRADRKSFNTIRFVDSSATSHEKLRRVLGI